MTEHYLKDDEISIIFLGEQVPGVNTVTKEENEKNKEYVDIVINSFCKVPAGSMLPDPHKLLVKIGLKLYKMIIRNKDPEISESDKNDLIDGGYVGSGGVGLLVVDNPPYTG